MMRSIIGYFCAVVLALLLSWGIWTLGKTLNYKLFYEAQVRQTCQEVIDENNGGK